MVQKTSRPLSAVQQAYNDRIRSRPKSGGMYVCPIINMFAHCTSFTKLIYCIVKFYLLFF